MERSSSDQEDHDHLVLPADERAPRAARLFVQRAVDRWRGPHTQDLELLTSEATSNAVLHTDTAQLEVRVDLVADRVRVSVTDDDPTPPTLVASDLSRPGGLGVRLIHLLADDWGVTEIEGDGKAVWFELELGA